MKLLEICDGGVKIFGGTVLKIKRRNGQTKFYALGLPLFKVNDPFDKIKDEFAVNNDFDVRQLDKKISKITDGYDNMAKCKVNNNRVGFLATAIYDMGGHTKWMRDMQKTLADEYQEALFLTTTGTSRKAAPQTLDYLRKISEIKTFKQFSCSTEYNVREIYDAIVEYAPQALFVFIHPNDFISTAVLSLIKKHTDIKVFFVNHATHRPALAMSFSDLVLEETPSSAYVTQNLRKIPQTHIVGLISKPEEENPHFTEKQIADVKQKIGIPQGVICTMSGAASYKFMDKNGSQYFEMIKKLLSENENLYHVVISEFGPSEIEIIDKIFENSHTKNRLIILPYQRNYELYFKAADLFIDSFPMSSALAFIDLMRLKVPYVVKINTENSALSFHEYQAKDFSYMYETVDELYKGINDLIKDENKRLAMCEKNYQHYMENYEPKAAKRILAKVIKCDDFSAIYDKLDKSLKYSFNK